MNRPLPQPTAETSPFWQACLAGELLYQACEQCGHAQYLPRRICCECHSPQLTWRKSQRLGTVYSHTTVRRAPTAAFRANVPYVVALIDMREGFRMMLNIIGCEPSEVAIGKQIQVQFITVDGCTLPQGELLR